jgi:hypothetical protein
MHASAPVREPSFSAASPEPSSIWGVCCGPCIDDVIVEDSDFKIRTYEGDWEKSVL